jgi:hypothetical protein
MLGLGMASAHAPMMFQKAQYWPKHLFTFDSDNLRSGTGEVRAWISAAAAMKRPATVVDYVPAHCTQTGCGFVYWPPAA